MSTARRLSTNPDAVTAWPGRAAVALALSVATLPAIPATAEAQDITVRFERSAASAARAPDVRGWTVMSRRSSEFVPQFKAEGHGNQLGVAVPHQLRPGRVACAPEPPAEAPDQTDGVAEARRRRQLA